MSIANSGSVGRGKTFVKCEYCEEEYEQIEEEDGENICTECLFERHCEREYNEYLLYEEPMQNNEEYE